MLLRPPFLRSLFINQSRIKSLSSKDWLPKKSLRFYTQCNKNEAPLLMLEIIIKYLSWEKKLDKCSGLRGFVAVRIQSISFFQVRVICVLCLYLLWNKFSVRVRFWSSDSIYKDYSWHILISVAYHFNLRLHHQIKSLPNKHLKIG